MSRQTIRVGDRVTSFAHAGTWTVVRMIRADYWFVRRAVIARDGAETLTVPADELRVVR